MDQPATEQPALGFWGKVDIGQRLGRYAYLLGGIALAKILAATSTIDLQPTVLFVILCTWAGHRLMQHDPMARKLTIVTASLLIVLSAMNLLFMQRLALLPLEELDLSLILKLLWGAHIHLSLLALFPLVLLLTKKAKQEFAAPAEQSSLWGKMPSKWIMDWNAVDVGVALGRYIYIVSGFVVWFCFVNFRYDMGPIYVTIILAFWIGAYLIHHHNFVRRWTLAFCCGYLLFIGILFVQMWVSPPIVSFEAAKLMQPLDVKHVFIGNTIDVTLLIPTLPLLFLATPKAKREFATDQSK